MAWTAFQPAFPGPSFSWGPRKPSSQLLRLKQKSPDSAPHLPGGSFQPLHGLPHSEHFPCWGYQDVLHGRQGRRRDKRQPRFPGKRGKAVLPYLQRSFRKTN